MESSELLTTNSETKNVSYEENNENTEINIIDATTPSTISNGGGGGIKRIANTPPDSDVKKAKVLDDTDNSVEIIDALDVSKTPKTPKTPKLSKEERDKLKNLKLEEKEKQKAEREKIMEEKRLEKERLLEEKRLEKEKKEKEKIEKKMEEDRRKEEKRKEMEEKKRKEEEEKLRKKREEEEKKEAKRKEEEERKELKKREEEAIEEKKRRESQRFLNFFNKVEKKKTAVEQEVSSTWYRPFELKDGMMVAPILPREPLLSDVDLLKHNDDVTSRTYLSSEKVKNRVLVPITTNPLRTKLFQFHDNRRPPYYGTWRKKAKKISGRRPTTTEEPGIDYEVDSDDEWEDEPSDGEECRSDDEDEGEDEVMSDDGFFVPPCYLSDGEGEDEGSDVEGADDKELVDGTLAQATAASRSTTAARKRRVGIESDGEEDEEDDKETDAGREHKSGGDGKENAEQRKARLASRAKEWSRRVSRGGPSSLVSRCIGPCYGGPSLVAAENVMVTGVVPMVHTPVEFHSAMKTLLF